MDAFTPQQTTELVCRIGYKKSAMRLDKLFVNAFMSGPLLGFGCAVALSTETASWYQENAPGLIRSIGALFFPIGLVMIVLSGADLFTSNVMFMTCALLSRRVGVVDVLKNWVVSFFGNLAGMLFFMAIVTGYGGVFQMDPYREEILNFATTKAVDPTWGQILCRAIGANWLVCFAVFISISSRDIASKVLAIWWPTATFVALGLDHVIANMYFIPISIWLGHPDITVGYYIWKSMIPTTIGNLVGGGCFVGGMYWYLYLTGEEDVEVDFNLGPPGNPLTVGGFTNYGRNSKVVHGRDPETSVPPDQPVYSGSHMISALGKELSAEKYPERKKNDSEMIHAVSGSVA